MPNLWGHHTGDLSSISGSDSSEIEENLTLSGVVEEVEEMESETLITSASCGSPLLTFSNGSDQCLAVYRCVLTASRVCWCGAGYAGVLLGQGMLVCS